MHDTPISAPLPRCHGPGTDGPADDTITLDYDARLVRRRRMVTAGGVGFLLDLPETVSLEPGTVLALETGLRVMVSAAPEPLLEVRGPLTRLAWHIGNRHTPCEIGPDWLRIRADHVLADMLARLGADLREVTAPFAPEGGAYGHGRTFGHDHGSGQGHSAAHEHDHDHKHGHSHDNAQTHSHEG